MYDDDGSRYLTHSQAHSVRQQRCCGGVRMWNQKDEAAKRILYVYTCKEKTDRECSSVFCCTYLQYRYIIVMFYIAAFVF